MSRPGVDWPPPLSVKGLAEVDPGLALQESACGGGGAPGERVAVSVPSVLVGTLVRRLRVRPALLLYSWESVPGRPSSSGFPLMNRFATSPSGGGLIYLKFGGQKVSRRLSGQPAGILPSAEVQVLIQGQVTIS